MSYFSPAHSAPYRANRVHGSIAARDLLAACLQLARQAVETGKYDTDIGALQDVRFDNVTFTHTMLAAMNELPSVENCTFEFCTFLLDDIRPDAVHQLRLHDCLLYNCKFKVATDASPLLKLNAQRCCFDGTTSFCAVRMLDTTVRYCYFDSCSFSDVYFENANFEDVVLCGGAWCGSNLCGLDADGLYEAEVDWSGVKGLTSQAAILNTYFERHPVTKELIAYKVFGAVQSPPDNWVIEPGSTLRETVNPNRWDSCGCGINCANPDWFNSSWGIDLEVGMKVWRVLIPVEAQIVVPHAVSQRLPFIKLRTDMVVLDSCVDVGAFINYGAQAFAPFE